MDLKSLAILNIFKMPRIFKKVSQSQKKASRQLPQWPVRPWTSQLKVNLISLTA
jgi:hypothetical protein